MLLHSPHPARGQPDDNGERNGGGGDGSSSRELNYKPGEQKRKDGTKKERNIITIFSPGGKAGFFSVVSEVFLFGG